MNIHQSDYAKPDVCGVQSCAVLKKYHAASLVMRCRIDQARSRVRGPGLMGVEEMFDRVSREAERISKTIAERAEYLSGTVQCKKPLAPMPLQTWPYLLGIAGEKQQIIDAWEAMASFAQLIRDDTRQISRLNDQNTEYLFIAVLEEVEQELEFIEAQLAQQ
jgi:DNA-binding ferritin-like protein